MCPCRVQRRTEFPFVCTYSMLSCIAVWARRCHSGFMQHCCFAQAIAPCSDDFAGPCRGTCIRTRRHCACDHLTCERVMGPRCPRSSMVIKLFSFYVVIRDVVAGVRCALQGFIAFAPVPSPPPTPGTTRTASAKPTVAGESSFSMAQHCAQRCVR